MTIGRLRDLFREQGCYLVRIRLAMDEAKQSKGHAVVALPERDAARAIGTLDGYELAGRALKVVQRKAPQKETNRVRLFPDSRVLSMWGGVTRRRGD
jgi:hypothetical protein